PGTSTTRPMTRGLERCTLKVTTTSRTRPTGSPKGSNTASSASRPTKTRVFVLTDDRLAGSASAPVPRTPACRRATAGGDRCPSGLRAICPRSLFGYAVWRDHADRRAVTPAREDVAGGVEPVGSQQLGGGL